ncbi:thermonuclease family protein [Candidatus Bathyarchaeota archaeon]|nr:thermonuclease family protein [Candidatus Bathyarchaeota archaeon]
MVMKQATVVEILDAISFRLRTDAIIVLDGVTPPAKGSEVEKKAREKLAELVLKKKVSYETTQFDEFGRTRAKVQVDGIDINKNMADYLKSL